jgi:hypothetical protein
MKRSFTAAMLVLFPFLLGTEKSQSQVVYGGDGSAAFGGPSLPSAERVRIDTTTECPTPVLSIAGFSRNADNWGRLNSSDVSSGRASGYSGFGNFGVAAGISVPFASSSIQACNELAVSSARRRQSQRELELLANCKIIYEHVGEKNLGTIDPQRFPEAAKCKNLKFAEAGPETPKQKEEKTIASCLAWHEKGIDFSKLKQSVYDQFPSLQSCRGFAFVIPTQRLITERKTQLASPSGESNINSDGFPVHVQINQ